MKHFTAMFLSLTVIASAVWLFCWGLYSTMSWLYALGVPMSVVAGTPPLLAIIIVSAHYAYRKTRP